MPPLKYAALLLSLPVLEGAPENSTWKGVMPLLEDAKQVVLVELEGCCCDPKVTDEPDDGSRSSDRLASLTEGAKVEVFVSGNSAYSRLPSAMLNQKIFASGQRNENEATKLKMYDSTR
ncbi:hypothetical protein CR513_54407, partial [Mucuna pruriens]